MVTPITSNNTANNKGNNTLTTTNEHRHQNDNPTQRILVVSHQLPFVMNLNENGQSWTFQQRQGHTALYSGIQALVDSQQQQNHQVFHIGWTGYCFDSKGTEFDVNELDVSLKNSLSLKLKSNNHIPVFLSHDTAVGHYEGYCKSDLWPLFHYILWDQATNGIQETKNWRDYESVNDSFSQAILSIYKPGDMIWIHDYHLMLLPAMLRESLPKAHIGFFVHTPFPSSEIFRCLPKRKEVLEGLLGSNLIGFQTYSYARHFISSCTRVLGLESTPKGVNYNGAQVNIGIFPVGIDVQELSVRKESPSVQEKIASIRELYSNKKIIIGRDKLDQINGVRHKLQAFERFLNLHPEWRNNVILIQVTTPPPHELPKLESQVSELVSRINGQYGSLEFTPIRHYHQHLDQDEYVALLSLANVALVTAVRDSMNTTSLEFIVCQEGNSHGPLILSEFTGTAGSLSAAMMVNPWDYSGVANAIHEALTMSKEEKYNKHRQLYDHVCRHTAEFWATSFIKEMQISSQSAMELTTTPYLDNELSLECFKNANRRLLLFDYDGTLTAIRKVPHAAVPPKETLEALKILAADPKNDVFVISGRDQACLDDWLGHIEGLGLSAEHGCFLKMPHEDNWTNLMEETDLSWKNEVTEIFNYYTERTPGSFVEHKEYSITWHYRLADPDFGGFQAKECQNHLENAVLCKLPVEILLGKKNLEVRPISINKGEIVKKLQARHDDWGFIFCAGDDKTDEDMFKVLRPKRAMRSSIDPYTTVTAPAVDNGILEAPLSQQVPTSVSKNGHESNNSGEIYKPSLEIFTCTIGPSSKKTAASWHVEQPAELISLLTEFSKCT